MPAPSDVDRARPRRLSLRHKLSQAINVNYLPVASPAQVPPAPEPRKMASHHREYPRNREHRGGDGAEAGGIQAARHRGERGGGCERGMKAALSPVQGTECRGLGGAGPRNVAPAPGMWPQTNRAPLPCRRASRRCRGAPCRRHLTCSWRERGNGPRQRAEW